MGLIEYWKNGSFFLVFFLLLLRIKLDNLEYSKMDIYKKKLGCPKMFRKFLYKKKWNGKRIEIMINFFSLIIKINH